MRVRYYYAGALLFLTSCSFADTTTVSLSGIQMKQSGWVAFDGGEIVQSTNAQNNGVPGQGVTVPKTWVEDLLFKYANECLVTERMRVSLSVQCAINYSYPYAQYANTETVQPQITFIPDRAEATYTIGNFQKPTLQFGFGYFPFKTDPDAKNLGDYLFRTGTYPVYEMYTGFDWATARLLGLRVTSNLFDGFHQDLLLTSSTMLPPLMDGSLTYLADYSFGKILNVGAGVSFVDLFPVDGQLVTPQNSTTQYIKSITKNGNTFDTATSYYTFAAAKPMVRFAFDPKLLIADLVPGDLFGKEDCRLYGEACVTGWEDYPESMSSLLSPIQSPSSIITYANRNDRTLYMAGFDFPTFKTLDVLSIEVEHYPNRYPNDDYQVFGGTGETNAVPLPLPYPAGLNDPNLQNSGIYPWFWSFYAKKNFLGRFSIIAQFARDHMRPFNNNVTWALYNTGDAFEQKGDWWWNVRLRADY